MSADDPCLNPRLQALYDLNVSLAREALGRHEYDGVLQDLSTAGVRAALTRVGEGPEELDALDEAILLAAENGVRVLFGEIEDHRRNPLHHIANLDVACYDRLYAPTSERAKARDRHIAGWPAAVDQAVATLDSVPAEIAAGLVGAVRGLVATITDPAAGLAVERLAAHLEECRHVVGGPAVALGPVMLARLMGAAEATTVDLDRLSEQAAEERDRLTDLLSRSCDQLRPGVPPAEVVRELLADHPSEPEEIYAEARGQIVEATAFTLDHDLLPDPGGVCLVGAAPASRSWCMAMMSWTAPYEKDAPSWYHVTPPDPTWPAAEQAEWLAVFSRTALPAITVHEVTPGHYAHGRMLRRLTSDVRRSVHSDAFIEGWAHYVEELFVEEGFRAGDPRFAIGVYLEALVRVTRLAVAIGIHTGGMGLDEAVDRFTVDAYQPGAGARSEAVRATFDPTYGRYTWGKLTIQAARHVAQTTWGAAYTHRRFHEALLACGSPPLGLLGQGIARG